MIADSSNSISNRLWTRLTGVIRLIATGFDIGPGAAESKVALVKYGKNIVRDFDFNSNPDKTTVLDAISSAERLQRTRMGGTATPDAILECLKIFEEQGQTGVPQVIMVFTDGVTFYKKLTLQAAHQRLQDAVNMSTAAGTVNFGVVFTGNNPEEARRESLTIAQGVQERAFYNSSLRAIELQIVKELSCGTCISAMILECVVEHLYTECCTITVSIWRHAYIEVACACIAWMVQAWIWSNCHHMKIYHSGYSAIVHVAIVLNFS